MRHRTSFVVAIAGVAAVLSMPGRAQQAAGALPSHLWKDVTAETIGTTAGWTNKVEIADINGDGRPDLLFANGGNYSDPGTPEMNGAFINNGPGKRFDDRSKEVFGTPGLTRVIKARDVNNDGIVDLIVGNTFQTQTRLYLGTGGGGFRDVTETNLPHLPASVGRHRGRRRRRRRRSGPRARGLGPGQQHDERRRPHDVVARTTARGTSPTRRRSACPTRSCGSRGISSWSTSTTTRTSTS